ncbi:MAG TPA: Arm DNA-binding domain-containing protein, partial [Longimicrobiales bacterium]|nr:Arm DNA-binding domain-containing protein [Longimicrobiales bacterium]
MVSHRTPRKPLRRKLTKAVCTAAKYAGDPNGSAARRHVIWDTELKGFGLRVFPSGVKVFVFSYRDPAARRKRLLTLGRFGALTVDQARKQARSEHVKVSAGIDPAIKVE